MRAELNARMRAAAADAPGGVVADGRDAHAKEYSAGELAHASALLLGGRGRVAGVDRFR